jgi:hypothetical protein
MSLGGIKKSFMVLNYFSMENDTTPYSNQTISDKSLKNTKKSVNWQTGFYF